jgi:WD40 repeat protein
MKNENILKLIVSSYSQFDTFIILVKSTNKVISEISLRKRNYELLYKSLGRNKTILQEKGCQSTPLCLLPDGKLITRTWGNKLKIFNTNTYKVYNFTAEEHSDYIQSIILLPNGVICSSTHDGEIKVWNNMRCLKTVYLQGYKWFYLKSVLPNNHLICTGFHDGGHCITILDLNDDFRCVKTIKESNTIYTIITIYQDRLASGSTSIKVWEANSDYECVYNLVGHKDIVYSLLYDEKNRFMISGSYDATIKFWDIMNNFQCIKTITNLAGCVNSLLLLPGGYLVSATINNIFIKIWCLKRFLCVRSFKSEFPINSFTLLKDYRMVSSTDKDSLIIWGY